jgi:hypothetical protein
MSSIKEHFRESADFHKKMSKKHTAAAPHHHALAKLHDDNDEMSDHHKALAEIHEGMAQDHADHAAYSLELCEKAADTDDLSKLVPDHVRSIIPPSEAYGSAAGLTAIPRTGAPQLNPEKPDVPLEFEHLVKVD